MTYIAICPKCPLVFYFGSLSAPNATQWTRERADVAYCPVCKTKSALAESSETGFLKAYHQAIPHALGKKQRTELITLLRKVAVRQITPEQALKETKLSPESKKIISSIAKWTLGGIGAATGLISLGLGLAERAENQREHAETMRVLNELVQVQRDALQAVAPSDGQKESKRTQRQSPKRARDKTSAPPTPRAQPPRTKKKAKRGA